MTELTAANVALPVRRPRVDRIWLLIVPVLALFAVFFAAPIVSLFSISLNPPVFGIVTFQPEITLTNFIRFFSNDIYYGSAIASIVFSLIVPFVTLVLGYPLAYIVARTKSPGLMTFFLILILGSLQLDIVVRLYGLTVLFGDNGLINGLLRAIGLIEGHISLMYNETGVVLGLVQLSLPVMVLASIAAIRGIDHSYEEAGRSLGASHWAVFWRITFPLSIPGVLAGSLLVFGITISSYVVPSIMGGNRVFVMPMNMYNQITSQAQWQFGAAIGVVLFTISLVAIFLYHRFAQRQVGGLV